MNARETWPYILGESRGKKPELCTEQFGAIYNPGNVKVPAFSFSLSFPSR